MPKTWPVLIGFGEKETLAMGDENGQANECNFAVLSVPTDAVPCIGSDCSCISLMLCHIYIFQIKNALCINCVKLSVTNN